MTVDSAFLGNDLVKNRIDKFFSDASIYVPNKYSVVLYGQYVENAIKSLQDTIEGSANSELKNLNRVSFNKWKAVYYDTPGKFLDLRWACSSVSIPTITAETETDYNIDSTKSIRYPLIKGYKNGPLTMRVTEDSKLLFYQFFNALTNQFFNPKVLKPNSSFQKLNIAIGTFTANEKFNPEVKNPTSAAVAQVFEFNSAVLMDFGNVELNSVSNTKLEYNIKFNVPNAFQSKFNSSLESIRDNTTDKAFLSKVIFSGSPGFSR